MKQIKNFSIKLIVASVILFSASTNCYASDVDIQNSDEIKTTQTKEVINLDKIPSMEEYIAKSRKKIKNNWYPPAKSFENTATIVVTLDRAGKLLKCVIIEPSPDEEFNQSLIQAANKTKFSPLPEEYTEDFVDIDYTFNMQKRHITK